MTIASTILIGTCIIVAGYLVSTAIDLYRKQQANDKSLSEDYRPPRDEVEIVSTIAGNLIAGVLANPSYWKMEKEHNDQLWSSKTESGTQMVKDSIEESSVFHDKGREHYVNLAWRIYNSVKNSAA